MVCVYLVFSSSVRLTEVMHTNCIPHQEAKWTKLKTLKKLTYIEDYCVIQFINYITEHPSSAYDYFFWRLDALLSSGTVTLEKLSGSQRCC